MKKVQLYFPVLLLAVFVMLTTSCKKIEEAILKDPCADIKFCNIKSFTYPGDGDGTPNTATFTYDALGNPLTVSNTAIFTGAPNLVFRYDASHRLTEVFKPYSNGIFETWTKYFYDASGRIAYDTTYLFGTITPTWPPVQNTQGARTEYTYDGTCRITKTVQTVFVTIATSLPAFPLENDYAYDAAGNLVRPGITYDNKVNIHRTNKIFMFLDRDFSMNNPFTAATYNGYSLPTAIGVPPVGQFLYFLQRPINNATFAYLCD